ncbi:MAG: hypothetical protein ACI8RD_004394 [Bacillariaceae sp.]|jgi:hypothetical protein
MRQTEVNTDIHKINNSIYNILILKSQQQQQHQWLVLMVVPMLVMVAATKNEHTIM